MRIKIFAVVLAGALPMLAMAQDESKKIEASAEPKVGGEIIFAASFNDDFTGENSQGKVEPLNKVKAEQADGKFGKAAKFSEAGGAGIEYPLIGNIELKKGKIDVWICPDFSPEDNQARSIFEIRGIKDKAKKLEVNSLGLMKMQYDQLRAYIYDRDGKLHRAYLDKPAMKPGEWYHIEMSWDMENPLDNGKYIKLSFNGSSETVQYGLADRKIEFESKDTKFRIGKNFLGSIDAFAIMK